MLNYELLCIIWYILIVILITGFMITDGLDMGVGVLLFILGQKNIDRRIIINTIAPHWDGNQVWFITAAGAMFAAWPNVYATLFSSFYMIMFILLIFLFLRPIGFEYRTKLPNTIWETICDIFITIGSIMPIIAIGIILGYILQGIPFYFDKYYHIYYNREILLPFSLFNLMIIITTVLVVLNQAATFLQLRINDKHINNKLNIIIPMISMSLIFMIIITFIYMIFYIRGYKLNVLNIQEIHYLPLITSDITYSEGFWINNFIKNVYLLIIPISSIINLLFLIVLSIYQKHILAFICSIYNIISIIITIAIAIFPFIIPSTYANYSLTIWNAASSRLTLSIMLYVALIFIPIMLLYSYWCYKKMFFKITKQHIQKNPLNYY
ncbi:cytochrome d ubiquinol oxidase subunit II [Enterobacteriaceae endosymbiont of Macroplea mutica]|uniref:cytochrome d ubiquinol oxidase subunit II n=1 Tax=Enterobacteriaceae endosymbiont of Macroplea mutica TaxID=2675791 RepID=UPI001448CECE|nr:cytochrome d ubiquinol oxidase subunit II [Enterobacteriaceae endosymbiont of Macroplea mutica]QJC31234.1 cytochrome d ubiquinol oxidase subunit II [Enterobacteriaceae endosymbiont of Macroplea mutica]